MKKSFLFALLSFAAIIQTYAQVSLQALDGRNTIRCGTNQSIQETIRKNPGIIEKWRRDGERRLSSLMQTDQIMRGQGIEENIVIPVVFHLVDDSAKVVQTTDRDIYDQIELLNQAYHGEKADLYRKVIPAEMYNRVGRVNITFRLARRKPNGDATTGIERRINTTPDRISIKSTATGGLDAWNTDKYLNVWAGSFSGSDENLLGVATPPFYTEEGPQGVVIGLTALPNSGNTGRSYYPSYSEGATLIHEIGHYFYLWHTFGDEYVCNNNDFRIQPGWPLPVGAGPEGDDTPQEKADFDGNSDFGNPSQNYSDGCSTSSFGMMYGSFMNYFDDRALFMFSKGMKARIEGCINLYRPGLKSSDGATPPASYVDVYLANVTPRGIPERRQYVLNNSPLLVTVRNGGSVTLPTVDIGVQMDQGIFTKKTFSVNLSPGRDTVLAFGNISGAAGTHTLMISVSLPANMTDQIPANDWIQSYIFITNGTITAPFIENFSSGTFPAPGWQIWNPNQNATWTRDASSGFGGGGSASVKNYDLNGGGQLDDLISPAINMGIADSSLLTFKVAYAVYSSKDVSFWDGLEIYVSNDDGSQFDLVYKKTGNQLKTVTNAQTAAFAALPSNASAWRQDTVNLTAYLKKGKPLLLRFRNVNAHGNNLYLDDISVSAHISVARDVMPTKILNIPDYICEGNTVPSLAFRTNGTAMLTSLNVNYRIDETAASSVPWTGSLKQGESDTIALPALPVLQPGKHTLSVYTTIPNGADDRNLLNDTIRLPFYVIGRQPSPVAVDFENVGFPPGEWAVSGADDFLSWTRTTTAASTGLASMVINNFNASVTGARDEFISPIITGNERYDSVFVSFDYAYATGNSNGPGIAQDTLEVQISMDCGKSRTTIWKKWGTDLQTGSAAADPANGFIPKSGDWMNIRIPVYDITANNNFQVFFAAKSNGQNNLYLDNIDIYGKAVPERLKKQGYLIYPSPFQTQFIIRNYEEPVTLKSAALYNVSGQKVWSKDFNGTAFKEIYVDGSNLARGVYTVKLVYTDKVIVEKIVKQ